MLTILLRLLTFVWLLWILRRVLAVFLGKPVKTVKPQRDTALPTNTVRDPVCGMYMDPRLAIRVPGQEGDIFFCSEECRLKYSGGS